MQNRIIAVVCSLIAMAALTGLLMRESVDFRLLDLHGFKHDPNAVTSPTLGFRLKQSNELKDKAPGGFRHNAYGFIGPDFSFRKSDGTYRIICLGGSTTFGAGVETDRYSYPAILQQIFDRTKTPEAKGVETVNAGVFGYNSLHTYLQIATRLRTFSPDMYVIMDGLNDLDAAQAMHRRGCACEYTIPEAFDLVVGYERNLQRALDAAREDSVQAVLVGDPLKSGRDPNISYLTDKNEDLSTLLAFGHRTLPAAAASLAAKNGVPFVNPQGTFDDILADGRQIRRAWADDLHLTRYGYYLLAREVYRSLMTHSAVQKALGTSRAIPDQELDALFPEIVLWRPADGMGWSASTARLNGEFTSVNVRDQEPNSNGWSAFTPADREIPATLTTGLAPGVTRFRIYPRLEKARDSVTVSWISDDGQRRPVFTLAKAFDDSHWTPESAWYDISVPEGANGRLEVTLSGNTSQFWHNGKALLFPID